MKKSTLITTIAMIVVVVVALSTATYAWFSTSNATVASVTLSTTASAEFLLYEGSGTYSEGTGEYTFNSAAKSTVDLTAAGLTNDIFSPTSDTLLAVSVSGTTATVSGGSFFTADNTNKIKAGGAAASKEPDVLKIANVSGDATGLRLTFVLDLADESLNAMYAAAQVRFAAAYVKNSGAQTVITTGYYRSNEAAAALSSVGTAVTKKDENGETEGTPGVASTLTTGTLPTYNSAASKTGANYNYWTPVGNEVSPELQKYGLAENHFYRLYTYDFGEIQTTDAVYIAMYTWIEGWDTDLSAANASISIRYAFTSYDVS